MGRRVHGPTVPIAVAAVVVSCGVYPCGSRADESPHAALRVTAPAHGRQANRRRRALNSGPADVVVVVAEQLCACRRWTGPEYYKENQGKALILNTENFENLLLMELQALFGPCLCEIGGLKQRPAPHPRCPWLHSPRLPSSTRDNSRDHPSSLYLRRNVSVRKSCKSI